MPDGPARFGDATRLEGYFASTASGASGGPPVPAPDGSSRWSRAEVVANPANDLAAEGTPPRAGQYVAPGAGPGGTVDADLGELGSVQVSFVTA